MAYMYCNCAGGHEETCKYRNSARNDRRAFIALNIFLVVLFLIAVGVVVVAHLHPKALS